MSHDRGVLVFPARPAESTSAPQADRTADLHFRSAEEAARRGEYERAAAEFTYCIQLHPARIEAFARRADVLRVLGRSDTALADYTAYLAARPTDAAVLAGRGQLYALAGRYREAADDFTAAGKARPDDPSLRLSRGRALAQLGRIAAAVSDFTRVVELVPGNALPYFEPRHRPIRRGRPRIGRHRSDARSNSTRSSCSRWSGGRRPTRPGARRSRRGRPVRGDPPRPGERGTVRGAGGTPGPRRNARRAGRPRRGDPPRPGGAPVARPAGAAVPRTGSGFDRAEEDLDGGALATAPETTEWLCARGAARLRAGRLDPALTDYVEAARHAPTDGAVYLGQGLVYATRGDYSLALPYFGKGHRPRKPQLAEVRAPPTRKRGATPAWNRPRTRSRTRPAHWRSTRTRCSRAGSGPTCS